MNSPLCHSCSDSSDPPITEGSRGAFHTLAEACAHTALVLCGDSPVAILEFEEAMARKVICTDLCAVRRCVCESAVNLYGPCMPSQPPRACHVFALGAEWYPLGGRAPSSWDLDIRRIAIRASYAPTVGAHYAPTVGAQSMPLHESLLGVITIYLRSKSIVKVL